MNDRKIDTRSQFSTYKLGIDTRRFHLPSKSRGHLLRGQHTFASTRRGSTFPDSRTTRDIRCSRSREPPLSATRPLVYLQDKIERAFDKAATCKSALIGHDCRVLEIYVYLFAFGWLFCLSTTCI